MMAEFNIQSDSVDVSRIMEQIRTRIREKRGADYTEQQIHELASVKLERFLDSGQVRSDLVEHYRQLEPPGQLDPIPDRQIHHPIPWAGPPPPPEVFDFDQDTIYVSSRGPMGKLIRLIRKLLNPIIKLFFNPTPMVFALARQAEINDWTLQTLQRQTELVPGLLQRQTDLIQRQTKLVERVNDQFERVGQKFAAREEFDALNFEVLNNVVVEMTRLSVDMKNHTMRVESVAGRLDFAARRAQAVEAVGESRSPRPREASPDREGDDTETGTRPRRRRRRSRRRTEGPAAGDGARSAESQETASTPTQSEASAAPDSAPAAQPAAQPVVTTPDAQPAAPPAAPEPPLPTPPPDEVPGRAAASGEDAAPTAPPVSAPARTTVEPPPPRADGGTDEQ
jgi:hypothetical protein